MIAAKDTRSQSPEDTGTLYPAGTLARLRKIAEKRQIPGWSTMRTEELLEAVGGILL